ncbi:coiled-coil domain-containing protein 154 [Trichechus manatus latirostris]|uniref:Coiled-coil domain-containing protein 154 n=1 Tax=Trichechus manatus latirostris TaxID=127582 RepID=A0A2Y9FYU3_TRIMA|nr:coiled-coil domain-containing protein 154 [Trichechus manatus latirostris]
MAFFLLLQRPLGGPLRTLLLAAQLAWAGVSAALGRLQEHVGPVVLVGMDRLGLVVPRWLLYPRGPQARPCHQAAQMFGLVWARSPLRFTSSIGGCGSELASPSGVPPGEQALGGRGLCFPAWPRLCCQYWVPSSSDSHTPPWWGEVSHLGHRSCPVGAAASSEALFPGDLPAAVLANLNSTPSSGASSPPQLSPITLEDLGLLFGDGPTSLEPLSLEEISEKYESGCLAPAAPVPEHDTPKHWKQLEQWLADLQAEVACLRGHRDHCARATLGLLQELLQVRARVELQDAELKQLQQDMRQAARAPEKEACELAGTPSQTQMQALDKRLVEIREALGQIRRKQALQDSEHKSSDQELTLRLSKLTGKLRQEGQDWKAVCSTLQKNQEEASQRVECEVAKMQKMKTAEGARLQAEAGLWEELESRWQKLQERNEEHLLALRGQREEDESYLLEQCRGLDQAVKQLTKFVRQHQVSLNHILQARDAKGHVEKSQTGELTTYLQENLEAVRLAGELAQQEAHSALELLREKSQTLEASAAELARQVKDLGEHFVALSWRLELHKQTLSLQLSEVKSEWEGAERKSLEDLARWRQEAEAYLREVREKVDSLPRQIEGVSDKCIVHKSDLDLKITAEGKAREFQVEAVRQELAVLLSSVQLLKEDHPGRKVAEIQGKLATLQTQIMKLENSLQDNKTIQNLKFNTETKLRVEEIATLRESLMRLWSEEGPWALRPGSRRVLMSLVRQRFFVKDAAPTGEVASVNQWGVYQAARWLQWKAVLMSLVPPRRPRAAPEKSCGPEPTPGGGGKRPAGGGDQGLPSGPAPGTPEAGGAPPGGLPGRAEEPSLLTPKAHGPDRSPARHPAVGQAGSVSVVLDDNGRSPEGTQCAHPLRHSLPRAAAPAGSPSCGQSSEGPGWGWKVATSSCHILGLQGPG